MPAVRQVAMAGPTSGRGGSCMAAMPRNVRSASSAVVTWDRPFTVSLHNMDLRCC